MILYHVWWFYFPSWLVLGSNAFYHTVVLIMAEDLSLEAKNGLDQGAEKQAQEEVSGDIISNNDTIADWIEDGDDEAVDNDRVALGLIGTLWTNMNPNLATLISTMKGVWVVKNEVEIVHIGRNLYQIQLFH